MDPNGLEAVPPLAVTETFPPWANPPVKVAEYVKTSPDTSLVVPAVIVSAPKLKRAFSRTIAEEAGFDCDTAPLVPRVMAELEAVPAVTARV